MASCDFSGLYLPFLKMILVFPVPLGGVGNMRVTNPTITTLTVNWNPADGNVQGYKVIYTPTDGGMEIVVRFFMRFKTTRVL